MSRRKIAVIVGILFLVQMITYMIGASLIEAFEGGDATRASLTVGVLLTTCSGVAVVAIGVLMYRVLRDVDRRLAIWYPVLRVVEFSASTVFGAYLLIEQRPVPNHHLWVYIPTGIGGLILTYLLFRSRLVPRPIAVLGIAGYAALLIAVPLDLLGVVDTGSVSGLALLAPGGLFEVLVFPVWLLAKGFTRQTARASLPPVNDRPTVRLAS